jgi:membrane AbrB-like protein
MLLSAVIHLAGWTRATPPAELVAAAQVVVGTAIGCRFAGTCVAFVLRAVRLAGGATVLMLAVTVGSAVAVHSLTGLPVPYLVLAYSPGGLAEMSLVALALSFDAAFVATHHIVRIILVVVLAPQVYRLTERHLAVRPMKGPTEPGGGDG